MHIEFLVEEYSAEKALHNLLPKLVGSKISYNIHSFIGKPDLLTKLPSRLKGYRPWLPADWRIIILVDQDNDNCRVLKMHLEECAYRAGFYTKTRTDGQGGFQVINRLAIEELEAWFFGDPQALMRAFPRIPATIGNKAAYRNPDAIKGGTWEALERVLKNSTSYPGRMPKAETAEKISTYMDPTNNSSVSFKAFRTAILGLLNEN